ncbi:hypothetical protein [Microcystis aeruginosa]|jgi:hypothetical protein|uniref:Uncharacterized protein n=1 Tax=Microcystis aeruginosa NIES-298 TaxID=449468 RepID=A0A2H6BMS8_MICAE|nr:hypothetical protein [Microcystis aeruginosa]MDB9508012.1 hypothetical protein [Microcystis aeruginosa CS-338/01]GBD51491.1 hypothetical protein BGM30_05840 [Microcystis aeruginosa NIES-298]GBE98427.1 hypothetical protein NIES298_26750 [Microcystis aeruginosa NIES-298]
MKAINFKTILKNGILTIPPQYSPAWEGKIIRVIVLEDNNIAEPVATPPQKNPESLFSRLRQIKISAPADFSENIDAYLNGEKNA